MLRHKKTPRTSRQIRPSLLNFTMAVQKPASPIQRPQRPRRPTGRSLLPFGEQKTDSSPHLEAHARGQQPSAKKNLSATLPDFSHIRWDQFEKIWNEHLADDRSDAIDLVSKIDHYLFKGAEAQPGAGNSFIKGYRPPPKGTYPFARGDDLLSRGNNRTFNEHGPGMLRYMLRNMAEYMWDYGLKHVDWKQGPYNAVKEILDKTEEHYDAIDEIQKRATEIASEHYKNHPGGTAYGEGNAFKHALLSYLLTAELGEEKAKAITDANEVVPANFYKELGKTPKKQLYKVFPRKLFRTLLKDITALSQSSSLDALRRVFVSFKNFDEAYQNYQANEKYGINEADRKADLYNNWRGREVFKQFKNLVDAIGIFKSDAKQHFLAIPKIPPGWNP